MTYFVDENGKVMGKGGTVVLFVLCHADGTSTKLSGVRKRYKNIGRYQDQNCKTAGGKMPVRTVKNDSNETMDYKPEGLRKEGDTIFNPGTNADCSYPIGPNRRLYVQLIWC